MAPSSPAFPSSSSPPSSQVDVATKGASADEGWEVDEDPYAQEQEERWNRIALIGQTGGAVGPDASGAAAAVVDTADAALPLGLRPPGEETNAASEQLVGGPSDEAALAEAAEVAAAAKEAAASYARAIDEHAQRASPLPAVTGETSPLAAAARYPADPTAVGGRRR